MRCTFFILVLAVVAFAQPEAWKQLRRANPSNFISLRFALKQQNLDVLETTLLDVSDPTSPNYGKWWTKDAILDLVAPSKETTQSVIRFLRRNGVTAIENYRDALKVTTTVAVAEKLLQTSLFYYMHKEKLSKEIIRSGGSYVIPKEISQHVALVAGLMEFPKLRKQATDVFQDGVDGMIVPETINNLYQIPANFPGHPNSSLCLAEFMSDQAVLDSDLETFSQGVALPNITISKTMGTFNGSDTESTLDVEYGAAIAQNATIWFWVSPGWMYEFANDVANTPNPPLVISMSWGWPEPEQCHQRPPLGNCSVFESSKQYVERTNAEFQKLGLMGITLLAASGDQGAPGDGDADCSHVVDHVLSSIFPGASPWVLSVGATMLTNSTNTNMTSPPICTQVPCATSTEEIACSIPEALITTGGGFSDYVAMPSWQQKVVNAYLTSGVALPPARDFKKENRAFPDVSGLGHNYLVLQQGQWEQVDGTSCSTPVWGGIIALLNSYRMNNGKSSLGYVVPLIYQAYAADPTTFNDITQGNNKCTEFCCDKYGYEASKGWDPVTGLGTPVFPKLLKFVASLP